MMEHLRNFNSITAFNSIANTTISIQVVALCSNSYMPIDCSSEMLFVENALKPRFLPMEFSGFGRFDLKLNDSFKKQHFTTVFFYLWKDKKGGAKCRMN